MALLHGSASRGEGHRRATELATASVSSGLTWKQFCEVGGPGTPGQKITSNLLIRGALSSKSGAPCKFRLQQGRNLRN